MGGRVLVDGEFTFRLKLTLRKSVQYGETGGLCAGRWVVGDLTHEQFGAQTRGTDVKDAWPLKRHFFPFICAAVGEEANRGIFTRPQ